MELRAARFRDILPSRTRLLPVPLAAESGRSPRRERRVAGRARSANRHGEDCGNGRRRVPSGVGRRCAGGKRHCGLPLSWIGASWWDDAFERANKVADTLCLALWATTPKVAIDVVKEVAHRLRRLAGDGAPPLVARRLRGGAPLEARLGAHAHATDDPLLHGRSGRLAAVVSRLRRLGPHEARPCGPARRRQLDPAGRSASVQTVPSRRLARCNASARPVSQMAILSATPGGESEAALGALVGGSQRSGAQGAAQSAQARHIGKAPLWGRVQRFRRPSPKPRARWRSGCSRGTVSPTAVGVVVNRVALARGIFNVLTAEDGVEPMLMIGPSRGCWPRQNRGQTGTLPNWREGAPASQAPVRRRNPMHGSWRGPRPRRPRDASGIPWTRSVSGLVA